MIPEGFAHTERVLVRRNSFDDIREAIAAAEEWHARNACYWRTTLVLDRTKFGEPERLIPGPQLDDGTWGPERFLLVNTSKPSDWHRVAVWDARTWLTSRGGEQ